MSDILTAPPLMFTGQSPQGTFSERMTRVQELAKKQTPAAIQELTAALSDNEYSIRYMASGALRQIGGPEVVGVIKAYLQETDDGPGREEAEQLLQKLA